MFQELVLHGAEGTVSWHWHTAAVCQSWRVKKSGAGQWSLEATLTRADPLKLRQTPLRFNAPRKGGHWSWPVVTVTLTDPQHLKAALGPMEA